MARLILDERTAQRARREPWTLRDCRTGHQGHPCRLPARSVDRRGQRPDLRQQHLRPGRRRRSARRIRVRAHRQPDQGRAGGRAGGRRRGQIRPCVQLRHGGQRLRAARAAASRRSCGDSRRRLRRNVPAHRQGLHRVGCAAHPGRAVRSRRGPRSTHPAHPADLGGNAHQPAAVDRRYRRNRRDRRGTIGESVGGQHICLARVAAAADPRCRYRAALDHEIHRRTLRRGGWRSGHQRRGVGRGVRLSAERGRRGAGTVRRLPDHAWC